MPQELRKSMRMTPQQGSDLAVARIGRSEWLARVVNESAGGMEIDLDGFPEIGVGERVVVKIHSGWYDLSVVRVEITDEATRLGLKRISSLPELQSLSADVKYRHGADRWGSSRLTSRTVIAFCIAFGMFLPQLIDGAFDSVLGMNQPLPSGTTFQGLAFDSLDATANPLIYSLSSLSSPQLIESLSLRPSQQSELNQIYAETSRTLDKLYQQSNSMSPGTLQRESAKAAERAMLRVLRLLDDNQVQQWIDSLQEIPASPNA